MAADCYSLVLMGFFLLSFSCGVRGGRERYPNLFEKEVDVYDHVASMLSPNFTHFFSKAENSDPRRAMFALAFVRETGPFVGGSGDIVVWNPNVERNDQSLNIVGCVSNNINIYVGYGVFPTIYGDTKSRIFISTLIQGAKCINNATCMHFVEVNSNYKLGGILDVSVYNDPSKQRVLKVSLDKVNEKWVVSLNQERFGYFDNPALANMKCTAIAWGGSVVWAGKTPTTTQMGNGRFPKNDPKNSGAIFNAFAVNEKGITEENPFQRMLDNPLCYDIAQTGNHEFHYGGSGGLSNGCR